MTRRQSDLIIWTAIFPLVFVLAGAPAHAQGGAGISTTLSGSVVSSTGPVAGATVVARRDQTAIEHRVVSDSAGHFLVAAIEPGAYTVTISASGFKTMVVPDVSVGIGMPTTIRTLTLQPGRVEEKVTVTGGAAIVQTQTGTLTYGAKAEEISQLPLITRNTLEFVTTLPGVNLTTYPRTSSILGLPASALNITIDGLNTQDNVLKSTSANAFFSMINPRLDAVEQVGVLLASPGADSSGQGAVQIRFQTRSGTNKLTGSVYDYMRRTGWNSNFWFNEHQTLLPNDVSDVDTFGGRLGGPIVPDRLFYFFNYEESRESLTVTRNRTVLTQDALNGTFGYYVGSRLRQVNLLQLASANGQLKTTDPTIMLLLNAINTTLSRGTVSPLDPVTSSFAFQNAATNRRIYPTGRVDANLTKNNRAGVSLYVQHYRSTPSILNGADAAFPGFRIQGDQTSWRPAIMANWRTAVGANVVNEVRFGDTGWPANHWFDNVTADQFPTSLYLNFPLVSAPAFGNLWERRASPVLNIENRLDWIKGKHSFAFGGSFTRIGLTRTNQSFEPAATIGFDTSSDPAGGLFSTIYFPDASASDLASARSLYAMLTGRIIAMYNTAYLNPATGQYAYVGPSQYSMRQNEWGFFAQDSWRLRPNLTVNAGLRWEVQLPVYTANNFLTRLTSYDMLYGITGTDAQGKPIYFPFQAQGGSNRITLEELTPGTRVYNTDWNNVAPGAGIAWRPSLKLGSWLEKILSADPVLRGGYSRAYTREGTIVATDALSFNPGGWVDASRSFSLGNLYPNDGLGAPLLLRQTSRLGPPPFPISPSYPLTVPITSSINAMYPDAQTPWVHSFNVGLQRTIGQDTAVDVRYVGTRARGGWVDGGRNINELNVFTNGWMQEFQHAQQNYLINERTYGWNTTQGNSFRYNGLPGQYALPIFQAFFSRLPATAASDAALYTSPSYSYPSYLAYLTPSNPNPRGMATLFWSNPYLRQNGIAAGYPSNFFYMNPAVSSAYVTGRTEDALKSNFDAVQIAVRRRMAGGLTVDGSYQYIVRQTRSQNISLAAPGQDWYNQGAPVHTVKVSWVYELPFGQGKRFAGGVSRNLNRLIGGWSVAGFARVQSGNVLDFGNVRLVGMTDADLQDMFRVRFAPDPANAAITRVFMLPDDVIQNTIRAFSTTYATSTGYSGTAPSGRYLAPINTLCLQQYAGSCADGTTQPIHHYVTGPRFVRIDTSFGKRIDLTSRVYGDLRLEFLNLLNNVDFVGVTAVGGSAVNSYQVTSAYRDVANTQDPGGRLVQLVWRLIW